MLEELERRAGSERQHDGSGFAQSHSPREKLIRDCIPPRLYPVAHSVFESRLDLRLTPEGEVRDVASGYLLTSAGPPPSSIGDGLQLSREPNWVVTQDDGAFVAEHCEHGWLLTQPLPGRFWVSRPSDQAWVFLLYDRIAHAWHLASGESEVTEKDLHTMHEQHRKHRAAMDASQRVSAPPAALLAPTQSSRKEVLWGGRKFPATLTDEFFYVISGPPGQAKTTLVRLFIEPILEEILQTKGQGTMELANDVRLIVFEPKHEMYAWIASMWPKKTLAPLRLLCASDVRTVVPDFDFDYRSDSDALELSYSLFPEDPREVQKFFPDALRTLVSAAIIAIRDKLGFYDLRLLVLVLSHPGLLRHLVGENSCTKFTAELLDSKGEETAQNVRMTITAKLLKARLLAAHFDRAKKNKLSLERFLSSPGVLVITRDTKYHEQHDDLNGVVLKRVGQILEQLQADPTRQRKTYFVLDEFPVLAGNKPVPGIVDMFLRLRGLGVVFLITFQTYATLKRVYGEQADEILNTTRNFIILGSGDPTDAEYAAKRIGKERGFEAQKSQGAASGTNVATTEGTGDTHSAGRTANASEQFNNPQLTSWLDLWFGPPRDSPDGMIKTGRAHGTTASISDAHSKNRSTTEGRTFQTTEGVTWVYFDRDIVSPTELQRHPVPNSGRGIMGHAYRAGEPKSWTFTYEWSFIKKTVHERSDFIWEYIRRDDHEEKLTELTTEELAVLELKGVSHGDRSLWEEPGKPKETKPAASPATPATDTTGGGDWDKERPSEEDDPWMRTDFLNDQD